MMIYTPNAKSLVYNELHFISTSVSMPQAKISVDMDRLFDEVSPEIFALFVDNTTECVQTSVFAENLPQLMFGLELSN